MMKTNAARLNLFLVSCGLFLLQWGCVSTRAQEASRRRNDLVQTGQDILMDSEATTRAEIAIPFKPRFEVSGFNDPALSASGKGRECGPRRGC